MRWTNLFLALVLNTVLLAQTVPLTRGVFVTSENEPDSEQLQWIRNFKIIESGGLQWPLSRQAREYLRSAGDFKILVYDWMPAGYHYLDGSPDDPFMQWVYSYRYVLTLNPEGPFLHCQNSGYDWCQEYYFDFGIDSLIDKRVQYQAAVIADSALDGIFFDWASGNFIDEPEYTFVKDTFYARHPQMNYFERVARYYDILKQALPHGIIVTNQAFRRAEYLLAHTDYDMTESYVTTDEYTGDTLNVYGYGRMEVPVTGYYPVSENYENGTINDQIFFLDYLVDLGRIYGSQTFGGFIFMNYAAPEFVPTDSLYQGDTVYLARKPKNAIYFGYALPKLLNQIPYTEVPFDHRLERDSVYFYDLGVPLGDSYQRLDTTLYVRYYTNGLVLVGYTPHDSITVELTSEYLHDSIMVFDSYTGKWLQTGSHTLHLPVKTEADRLTGRRAPFGRVLIYDSSDLPYATNQDYIAVLRFSDHSEIVAVSDSVRNIDLYDMSGRLIARGRDHLTVPHYAGDAYVAVARSSDGEVLQARKIVSF